MSTENSTARAKTGNVDSWIRLARELFANGDYESATRLFEVAPESFQSNNDWVKLFRSVASKLGNHTESLRLSYILAARRAVSPASIRILEGRHKELFGFVPRILGPKTPIEPASDTTVVHLVKESAPWLSNGFTSRSQANFLSERSAGLNPVVLTEPGFIQEVTGEPGPATERYQNIRHYHFPLGQATPSAIPQDQKLQMFADWAYSKIKQIRPALIHASSGRRGYETALVGIALKEKTGLPLVYEVRSFFEANWTSDTSREETGEVFEQRMAMERMCMDAADLVLTIGESMKQELVSRGVSEDKIAIIPNGIDLSRFNQQDRNTDLALDLGIGNSPTIGYVSNMDHYRESQETIIEALKILRDNGKPYHCVLVGDGPRRSLLESLAMELNVSDYVHFTGRVQHDNIPDFYSLIDIFIVPRVNERAARFVTPLKPFEAMASGLPVIASDLPALAEIVDAPNRGLTFIPGDARSLAEQIEYLSSDSDLQGSITSNALEWLKTQRTWQSNGPRYTRQFARVTGAN